MSESRGRILNCACELFLADGLDGFSIRELARQLGVSAPALYKHFASKEAILASVIVEAFKVFGTYLYRGLQGSSPQDRLRMTGEGYVAFALEHPRYYEVIHLSNDVLGFVELSSEAEGLANATRQFLTDRVRECMNANVLKADDPELVAGTIWAFSHGLVSLFLGGKLPVQKSEFPMFFRVSISKVFAGLGGPAFVVPPLPALGPLPEKGMISR